MLNEGFILLHRSMLRWEWYGDGNTARLFIHLLLTVNYRPQHWRGLKIRRGQRVASVAKLAVIPLQDYLGLGGEARMNTPSTLGLNWKWRLLPDEFSKELAAKCRDMAWVFGRCR